jgi:exopolysaccharide production protein ExoZ
MVLLLAPFASTKAVIASLLFWPYPAGGAPVLNVGWTLNIEMFFYLVFAAALLVKRRAAVAASVSVVLLAFAWLEPASGPLAHFANPIIIEFVFGMMVALAYRADIRLPLWATIGLLAGGLTLFAAISPETPGATIPRQFSWGIAAVLIVAAVALSPIPKPTTLAIGIVVFLGDISYALYLTHNVTLPLAGPTVTSIVQPANAWLYGTAMVVICLVVAAATYLLLERPITRALQSWIGRAKTAGEPVTIIPQTAVSIPQTAVSPLTTRAP